MSPVGKKKRNEVISLRLTEDRMEILNRYREALTGELHRPISLSEAAFRVFEERAEDIDRQSLRIEMLHHPTASLHHIRRKWESQHSLSAPEWDVLAEYAQIGSDEERQEPPLLCPAIPSRESYLGLLDAFETVYRNCKNPVSKNAWDYFGNLDGHSTKVQLSDDDAQQRNQAVLDQIALRRKLLQPKDGWKHPGSIGRCFLAAVRTEDVENTRLNQILAPHWPTIWRFAARGHWLRNDRKPVRRPGGYEDDFRLRGSLPDPIESKNKALRLSFLRTGIDFVLQVEFRGQRRFSFFTRDYPEMVELHNVLEFFEPGTPWHGRTFYALQSEEKAGYLLNINAHRVHIYFSKAEWTTLRDLLRQAWENAELQPWLQELQQEYGEQG